MKFQTFLHEEYYKRVKAKYLTGTVEIFRNPTIGELRDIDKEYREEVYQSFIAGNRNAAQAKTMVKSLKTTIRFIFFPFEDTDFPTDKWYAASAKLIHDEFDVGGNAVQIRGMGAVFGNKVHVHVFRNENIPIVETILKKANLNFEVT